MRTFPLIIKPLAITALALITGQARAEVKPQFSLGTELYEETYLEWIGGQRFMKERALMKAVTCDFLLPFDRQNAMRVAAHLGVPVSAHIPIS